MTYYLWSLMPSKKNLGKTDLLLASWKPQMESAESGSVIQSTGAFLRIWIRLKMTRIRNCSLPVLRIRDVYPGSWILIFTHSGSRIPDPKTATKERGEKKFDVIPFYVAPNRYPSICRKPNNVPSNCWPFLLQPLGLTILRPVSSILETE